MSTAKSQREPTVRTTGEGLIDPASLMQIKSMELRAKVIVEGFMRGLHRSPYHGFSVEFTEYRDYTPGDDTRYIDWRLFARSDRHYVKKFEDETNLRCHLLVDQSRSMSYGSGQYDKATYAGTLVATLAYFLSRQGDAIGLATLDTQINDYIPPRNRPGHLRRIMLALDQPATGQGTDLGPPLERVAEMVTRRGMFVLVSDLLAPIDQLGDHLGYLRARGHEVVLFHVLDRAELELDIPNAGRLLDLETGRELYVDPEQARAEYKQKLAAHLDAITKSCDKLGIDYHLLPTDQPFELALRDFLTDRLRRGRSPAAGRTR